MTADGAVDWDQARHRVYDPGSFRPLAQTQGEDLHYIVTDHIGTPREMFSEDGERVAWEAEWDLWGDIAQLRQKAANDDAPPVDCPIRFQGQWYDAESGLHYNRFRYYDADAMQYLSPDPIGLAGGVRPQGYVGDPNGWVDPLGLAGCGGNATHSNHPQSGYVPPSQRRPGGTGSNYDVANGQGIYVLRDPITGNVEYVGRGDTHARGTRHATDPSKSHLIQEIIHDNNLTKAEAKYLEQYLMDYYGGPRSVNPNTPLQNAIRGYSPNNPNAGIYDSAGLSNGADRQHLLRDTMLNLNGSSVGRPQPIPWTF